LAKVKESVAASLLLTAVLVLAPAVTASAAADVDPDDHPVSGPIDRATYAGALSIGLSEEEVVEVWVSSGGAPQAIDDAVSLGDAADGTSISRDVAPLATVCGTWKNAVAGPGAYWTSLNGCALAGNRGYRAGYTIANVSSVSICSQGKGYNAAGTMGWYGLGCRGSGGEGGGTVPWDNVLAYTQARGMSLSGVTGASYQWKN
jgi:hypothetical protein